ncbi:MAG: response regulator transcription factor [Tyzzerella sp.]|nr:response regulator transcription factor [Tyzzerella sp.]
MKIALVDDQVDELERLFTILHKELPTAKYFTFSSGEEFLETWSEGAYDLVVLDVFMDGMLGIEVARTVRDTDMDVRIVFCTTSNEFASESYEVGANYYLHKPISETSVGRMLKMIRLDHYEVNRFIRLADGQRVVLRNVIYTEYYNHLIIVHCKNGQDIQTRMSQTDWETILSEHSYFYSSSKGIVVNFHEIVKQENGMFLMSDGAQVPISRRKTKDALEAYASFRFEMMRKE